MLTILHVSDLHFGPPFVPRVGEALIRIAPTLGADIIVASGDFTQRATADQFQAAREFLDRLPPLPLITVPGNHDVPLYRLMERFLTPHALYQQYISPELNRIWHFPQLLVVALDSTAPHTAITNGQLLTPQLDMVREACAAVPDDWARIVVAHHHLAPAPDYEGSPSIPQAKAALDCFTELRIDLVLGGHLHRSYVGNSLDVYPGKDREHGVIIVQCGTTTSRRGRVREREKNSFNLIHVDDLTIRIRHYMFFDDDHGFVPISEHLFPRHPARSLKQVAEEVSVSEAKAEVTGPEDR